MDLTHFARFLPFSFAAKHQPKTLFSPWRNVERIQQEKSRLALSTLIKISLTCNSLPTKRRSANYHPTIWSTKLIDSLSTPYLYETHANRLEKLKQEAKTLLLSNIDEDPFEKLELIDSIQRLGLAYHFEEEIKEAINLTQLDPITTNLYITSLHFRLLRENGFQISTDVFDKFRDKDGKFMETLSEDREGLLSLYEASHLGVNGEQVLNEAKDFSSKHLLNSIMGKLEVGDNILNNEIQQSMEVPLRWRMPRLEARNFIDIYRKNDKRSLILLELAKLDYNIVQSIHQSELKELQRWWTELGFKERLSFSRDRLVENYLWALGMTFEPEFSKCRIRLTKFVCILCAIDDMYDVYGKLDELELFTDAINRWDIKAIDDIPEYMRIPYFAIFNFVNEMAYNEMKDSGLHILPYLSEEWKNICRSFMVEARWFYSNYIPSFDEYIENAFITAGGPAAVVHVFLSCPITEGTLDSFKLGRELIRCSSLILRLCDDLGTNEAEAMRGDVAKSLQCYVTQTGATEEEAMKYVKCLISDLWRRLNKESSINHNYLPKSFINTTLNMARSAHCIFQHGDGIGISTGVTKERLISLVGEEWQNLCRAYMVEARWFHNNYTIYTPTFDEYMENAWTSIGGPGAIVHASLSIVMPGHNRADTRFFQTWSRASSMLILNLSFCDDFGTSQVYMFTGYLVGDAAFRALFDHDPIMSVAGGILGFVCGMLIETLLFIIRTSNQDPNSSNSPSTQKKNKSI